MHTFFWIYATLNAKKIQTKFIGNPWLLKVSNLSLYAVALAVFSVYNAKQSADVKIQVCS